MPVKAEVAQFIQNQQVRFCEAAFQFPKAVMILCFTQLSGQRCCIFEQNPAAHSTGFQAESNRQVGFSTPGVANHDNIPPILHKLTACQFFDVLRTD